MSGLGGARVPATGATCVLQGHSIGKVCTQRITPLMPPTLAPLHNPICPWEASHTWSRAFTADGLTMRSNKPQLEALGLPTPRPETADGSSLVPAVSQGRLCFVMRPIAETKRMAAEKAAPFTSFHSAMQAQPYLYATNRLPVTAASARAKTTPFGAPRPPATERPCLTPAHLQRNSYDPILNYKRPGHFSARRLGSSRFTDGSRQWQTMAMEQNESVFGEKAHY